MNSGPNFRECSISHADSANGDSRANENDYRCHSYGVSSEKRSDYVDSPNDPSAMMYIPHVNLMGKGAYPAGNPKINIICTAHRSCSEVSIAEESANASERLSRKATEKTSEMASAVTRSSNPNMAIKNSLTNKLQKNLDMSSIYNKYDQNGLLYCKAIKFLMKSETKHNYVKPLTVKINNLKSIGGKPYMRLELSDDSNELFFYYLDLYEENYESIKREQKLVINFDLFPFKFMDLLEECVLENEQCEKVEDQRLRAVLMLDSSGRMLERDAHNYGSSGNDNAGGKMGGSPHSYYSNHSNTGYNSGGSNNPSYGRPYGCSGNNGKEEKNAECALLNLVEINQFKELTHLSLQLKRADHENVISYLCNNIKYIKAYNGEIIGKLNEEIVQNGQNMVEIKGLQKTIEMLEKNIENLKCDFNNTLNNDINRLRKEHERIIEKKEEKFNCENEELKKDLESLKNKFTQLNEMNQNYEQKIFYLNGKVKNLKNELEEKNTNFVKLVKEKEDIECAKCELEKYKSEFTVEFNNLKSKYERECESNISNSSSFESIKISNSNLETELKKYKDRNGKLEKEINIAIDEINKGNDIITKLQTQLRKMKDKLKCKTIEHINVEKVSSQNVSEIGKLQGEVKALQEKLAQRESSEEALRREVDALQRRNDEMAKELNISREVNLRLNKEITNNNLDMYAAKLNMGGPPNVVPGANFRVDTNLLDKDLFTKLKANLKSSTTPGPSPAYAMDG
ncbi:hypothetical protein C922_03259 [Plasmodium inui San Antonio 1]|uniref:Spindle assembly abnormal protein 6 N-terminal domain-containing protein n=1 Tax=Plasmodium inui San Antonio 1 TaxID=1237626 RepID=W7A4W1_9APIC|nr:hypothetical protein C922_03259 [Plasmodium inui San Antonio 1]EUD66343.1 hypothetical protein C922_03259 [Plasmodium inui San Antonio 1]